MNKYESELIYDEVSDEIINITEKIVIEEGTHNVTVRKILKELGCTNRVFYNRFRNLDDVFEIIYNKAVYKMQESIKSKYDINTDFFEYIMDIATNVLINTYEIKKHFNSYMMEHDSLYMFISYALEKNLIKDVDPDMLSYTIWCFCRGYNADAFGRKISIDDAIKRFRYGFSFILDSLRIK